MQRALFVRQREIQSLGLLMRDRVALVCDLRRPEYGIDRDGIMTPEAPTYEELKEKADRLCRTCFLYWEFLRARGLREEADEYVREHIDEEWPFGSFDWDVAQ